MRYSYLTLEFKFQSDCGSVWRARLRATDLSELFVMCHLLMTMLSILGELVAKRQIRIIIESYSLTFWVTRAGIVRCSQTANLTHLCSRSLSFRIIMHFIVQAQGQEVLLVCLL